MKDKVDVLHVRSNPRPYIKERRKFKSSRNLPYMKVDDSDINAFVKAGWRVNSRKIHILPN